MPTSDVAGPILANAEEKLAKPRPATRYRWIILSIIVVTYMIAGADRANLGIAVPYMKREFHLSNSDIGTAASIFFLGLILIQIPASLVFQKIGVRPVMIVAVLLTSVSTFVIGLTGSALQLKSARAALGFAEGPINIGCLTIINRWFPPHERGTAVGIFVASIKLAPALVPPIGAVIIYAWGWRSVFYAFAVPGFAIAILWWLFVSDNPRQSKFTNEAEIAYIEDTGVGSEQADATVPDARRWPRLDAFIRVREIRPLETNAQIARSSLIWACAGGYGLLTGLTYAIMTWVPTYLVEEKGYSILQTGFVASAPWVGAVIGSVLGGLVSDRLLDKRRKPLMLVTASSTIVTMYALMAAPNHPAALAAMLVVTGSLLTIGYSTFLAYPMGLVTKAGIPFAVAIVSLVGAVGGAFAPLVVGLILDRYDWDTAFVFLSACSLCATLLVLFLIEPRDADVMPEERPAPNPDRPTPR